MILNPQYNGLMTDCKAVFPIHHPQLQKHPNPHPAIEGKIIQLKKKKRQ